MNKISGIQQYFTNIFYGEDVRNIEFNNLVFGLNYNVFTIDDLNLFIIDERIKFHECKEYINKLNQLDSILDFPLSYISTSIGWFLDEIKIVHPSLVAHSVCGVQPITKPSGSVFKMTYINASN